jgi:hypothetical protein
MNKIFEVKKLHYHKFLKSNKKVENYNEFLQQSLLYDRSKMKEKIKRSLVDTPDLTDFEFEKQLNNLINKVINEEKSFISGDSHDFSYNIAVLYFLFSIIQSIKPMHIVYT